MMVNEAQSESNISTNPMRAEALPLISFAVLSLGYSLLWSFTHLATFNSSWSFTNTLDDLQLMSIGALSIRYSLLDSHYRLKLQWYTRYFNIHTDHLAYLRFLPRRPLHLPYRRVSNESRNCRCLPLFKASVAHNRLKCWPYQSIWEYGLTNEYDQMSDGCFLLWGEELREKREVS